MAKIEMIEDASSLVILSPTFYSMERYQIQATPRNTIRVYTSVMTWEIELLVETRTET